MPISTVIEVMGSMIGVLYRALRESFFVLLKLSRKKRELSSQNEISPWSNSFSVIGLKRNAVLDGFFCLSAYSLE